MKLKRHITTCTCSCTLCNYCTCSQFVSLRDYINEASYFEYLLAPLIKCILFTEEAKYHLHKDISVYTVLQSIIDCLKLVHFHVEALKINPFKVYIS